MNKNLFEFILFMYKCNEYVAPRYEFSAEVQMKVNLSYQV